MPSKRSPNPSSSSFGKQLVQNKKVPAEMLTYLSDGELVYVEPAKDYEQALDYAQSVFPRLANVPRSRIVFRVNVRINGIPQKVRIAPMAWFRVAKTLATYEIVEVSVLPRAKPVASRAAKSDSDLATSSRCNAANSRDDLPPIYTSANMLGDNLLNPTLPLQDSEKSPLFTLQIPDVRPSDLRLDIPPLPEVKRCRSALSWFGKHH